MLFFTETKKMNLSPYEEEYLRSMKKKDRVQLLDTLHVINKCRAKGGPTPLRLQLLQSKLSPNVKMDAFDELSREHNDKYTIWVKKAVRLPINVFAKSPHDSD